MAYVAIITPDFGVGRCRDRFICGGWPADCASPCILLVCLAFSARLERVKVLAELDILWSLFLEVTSMRAIPGRVDLECHCLMGALPALAAFLKQPRLCFRYSIFLLWNCTSDIHLKSQMETYAFTPAQTRFRSVFGEVDAHLLSGSAGRFAWLLKEKTP